MPAQRIKGQEVQILIVQDGSLADTLTDIQNFNMEDDFELIQKGYLGEPTDRYDEVYKGMKFDFEMHTHTQDYLTFVGAIRQRAQRIVPDTVFNITAVFNYPEGDTPTRLLPDCNFGPVGDKVNSRGDYKTNKFQGAVGQPVDTLS
jgi:hypothetical protein